MDDGVWGEIPEQCARYLEVRHHGSLFRRIHRAFAYPQPREQEIKSNKTEIKLRPFLGGFASSFLPRVHLLRTIPAQVDIRAHHVDPQARPSLALFSASENISHFGEQWANACADVILTTNLAGWIQDDEVHDVRM
jgi:hypothetical protein